MAKSFGKSAGIIFAGISATLVLAGVGIWQIAEPVNTVYNMTAPLITKQSPDRNFIDESRGDSLVGLGILFACFSIAALFLTRRGRSY